MIINDTQKQIFIEWLLLQLDNFESWTNPESWATLVYMFLVENKKYKDWIDKSYRDKSVRKYFKRLFRITTGKISTNNPLFKYMTDKRLTSVNYEEKYNRLIMKKFIGYTFRNFIFVFLKKNYENILKDKKINLEDDDLTAFTTPEQLVDLAYDDYVEYDYVVDLDEKEIHNERYIEFAFTK